MIIHEAVGNHGNVAFPGLLLDELQKKYIIPVIAEDNDLMCATIVDMIIIICKERCFSSSHKGSPLGEDASHLPK